MVCVQPVKLPLQCLLASLLAGWEVSHAAGQRHLRLSPNVRAGGKSHKRKCITRATDAVALQSFDEVARHDNITRTDQRIAAIALPTLAALAAEPVATLVGATWVGRMGTMPLAACAAAVSVFSLATKLINIPLTAVTTSLVATASAHSAFLQQSPGNPGVCSWSHGSRGTWRGNLPEGKGQSKPATQEQRAAISSALILGLTIGVLQGMHTMAGCTLLQIVLQVLVATPHLHFGFRTVY